MIAMGSPAFVISLAHVFIVPRFGFKRPVAIRTYEDHGFAIGSISSVMDRIKRTPAAAHGAIASILPFFVVRVVKSAPSVFRSTRIHRRRKKLVFISSIWHGDVSTKAFANNLGNIVIRSCCDSLIFMIAMGSPDFVIKFFNQSI